MSMCNKMYNSYLPLILGSIFLNVFAQLAIKYGLGKMGYLEINFNNWYSIMFKVFINPYIILGLGCYILSVVLWIGALSRVDISYAYPMTSLGYVLTAMAGFLLFQENLPFTRILGIGIILAGVFLVSRT